MPDSAHPHPAEPAPDLAALQLLTDAGWGFYRGSAGHRADDQMLRALAGASLARAQATLAAAESAARAAIPTPTREAPLPDASAMAHLRALKTLRADLASLETRLRGGAAPPDRDATMLQLSAAQMAALVTLDSRVLAAARALEAGPDPASLRALDGLLSTRAALLAWR